MPNRTGSLDTLRLNCAFQLQLNAHGVIDLEQPGTRILQSPLDKGHVELRAARPMIAGKIRFRRHSQFVLAAVEHKNPVDLYPRFAVWLELSCDIVRPENNLAEFSTFEHFLVHFLVSSVAAAFSAGGVHNDFSARFPCRRIDLQTPALQDKSSMHGVQRAAKRPMHATLRWINREGERTGRLRRSILRERGQNRKRCQERSIQMESRLQPVS